MRLGEEHFVTCATDGVVVRTRSVQLIPNAMSMDLLNKFGGAPWEAAGIMEFQGSISGPSQTQDPLSKFASHSCFETCTTCKITKASIDKFDHAKSCPRLPGVSAREVAQSRERRDWIEQKIRGNYEFKTCLEVPEERKTHCDAGEVQRLARATGHNNRSRYPLCSAEMATKRRWDILLLDQTDTRGGPDTDRWRRSDGRDWHVSRSVIVIIIISHLSQILIPSGC